MIRIRPTPNSIRAPHQTSEFYRVVRAPFLINPGRSPSSAAIIYQFEPSSLVSRNFPLVGGRAVVAVDNFVVPLRANFVEKVREDSGGRPREGQLSRLHIGVWRRRCRHGGRPMPPLPPFVASAASTWRAASNSVRSRRAEIRLSRRMDHAAAVARAAGCT